MNIQDGIRQMVGVLTQLRTVSPLEHMTFDAVSLLNDQRDPSQYRLHCVTERRRTLEQ